MASFFYKLTVLSSAASPAKNKHLAVIMINISFKTGYKH